MLDFQNYKAILDVDGQSWSSRFGTLTCYNSVILKVDPDYVDYFFYKKNHDEGSSSTSKSNASNDQLLPWKHYIPVKGDLSDLVQKSQYALSVDNHVHIESIIRNANQWCLQHMIHDSIAYDVLDSWESYIRILDASSFRITTEAEDSTSYSSGSTIFTWEKQWMEQKDRILNGPLLMKKIV